MSRLNRGLVQRIFKKKPQPRILGIWLDGRDFFVDRKRGNDSNAGTIDSPFCSLQHAIYASDKGDRIFLEYNED